MFTHNDRLAFNAIASGLKEAGTHDILIEEIGMFEIVNHISTVMFAVAELNRSQTLFGLGISIRVGEPSNIQTQMAERGIKSLIAMTPKNPTWDSGATAKENYYYVDNFKNRLGSFGIDYTEAFGMALDFAPGNGCLILINVSVKAAKQLLEDSQLSFIHLPQVGLAELVSCVD